MQRELFQTTAAVEDCRVTCPYCGYGKVLDDFDSLGVFDELGMICPGCLCEFDSPFAAEVDRRMAELGLTGAGARLMLEVIIREEREGE